MIENASYARVSLFSKWVEVSIEEVNQYLSRQILEEGWNKVPSSEMGNREVVSQSLGVGYWQSSVLRTKKETPILTSLHFSTAFKC